jgi:integrase
VSEVANLKIDDIDSTRMLVRVEQGKGRKDRNATLSPQLLALLRLWWKEGKRRSSTSQLAVSQRQRHRSNLDAAGQPRDP